MTPPPPPEGDHPRHPASAPLGRGTVIVMAAVLTLTLVVFAFGVMSLVLDRDVIREPDAGPLLGPVMVLAVLAVVLWFVIRRRPVAIGARAAAAGIAAIIAGPAVGGVLYSVGQGRLLVFPVFFGTYVLSPFVLISGLIAGLVVVLAWLAEGAR